MSKYHPRPKGQQPVDKKYKHKDNSIKREKYLKERREHRYNSKKTIYGHKINSAKALWEFLTSELSYKDTYNNVLTQAERNLIKMYPCGGQWAIGGKHYHANDWYSIEGNSFIIQKRNKFQHSYFNEAEWKDMIDFIRDATIRRGANVHTIIFCKEKCTDAIWELNYQHYKDHYNDEGFDRKNFDKRFPNGFNRAELERLYFPKLYEKEKQFIINAGCEFIGDIEFEVTRSPLYNGDKSRLFVMEGWKFKLNLKGQEPYKHKDIKKEIKPGKLRNYIIKIKNIIKG